MAPFRAHGPSSSRPSEAKLNVEELEDRRLLAVFAVQTTADTIGGPDLSLRDAIIAANSNNEADEINLMPNLVYNLTRQGSSEDLADTGDLDIRSQFHEVTINGNGSTINAVGLDEPGQGHGDRIFHVTLNAELVLHDLTLTQGHAPGNGGAILNVGGTVTVNASDFVDNVADGAGGAISNEAQDSVFDIGGTATITDSDFSGNESGTDGGAIHNGDSIPDRVNKLDVINGTLSGNTAGESGGAIFNAGDMTVTATTVDDNQAEGGGGIASHLGDLAIIGSTISNNDASVPGPGIGFGGGGVSGSSSLNLLIRDSTVFGNTTDGSGGGVNGSFEITNTTISGNSAERNGGGVSLGGSLSINHSTITNNYANSADSAGGIGGGIYLSSGSPELTHTIVAGNFTVAGSVVPDGRLDSDIERFSGMIDAQSSYNLIGDPGSDGGLNDGVNGNIVGLNNGNTVWDITEIFVTHVPNPGDPPEPLLANNGGPTLTHALVLDVGNPAIDAGDEGFLDGGAGNFDPPLIFDQRQDSFSRVSGGRIDMGAYETNAESAQTATVSDRHLFYNESSFDGNTPGIDPADSSAIPSSKTAYLPGDGTITAASMSSYSRGLNGIFVDIAGPHAALTLDDFQFAMSHKGSSANNTPSTWIDAPAPTAFTVLSDTPSVGTDRVQFIWANNAIENRYLEVTVEGLDATGGYNFKRGPVGSDIFYFGNIIGDTFNGSPGVTVWLTTATDETAIQAAIPTAAPIDSLLDMDRNGVHLSSDRIVVRSNTPFSLDKIDISAPPAAPAAPPAAGGSAPAATPDAGTASMVAAALAAVESPPPRVAAVDGLPEASAPVQQGTAPIAQLSAARNAQPLAIDLAEFDLVGEGLDDESLESLLAELLQS